MTCRILRTNPVLPVRNIETTAGFYASLGFTEILYKDGAYMVAARDGFQIHFICQDAMSNKDAQCCYIHVDKVDAFRASIRPDSFDQISEVALKPATGHREFSITDPDKNVITIGEITAAPLL